MLPTDCRIKLYILKINKCYLVTKMPCHAELEQRHVGTVGNKLASKSRKVSWNLKDFVELREKSLSTLYTGISKGLHKETFFLYSQELVCIHRCQKVECILAPFVRTLLYMQIERWPAGVSVAFFLKIMSLALI
jgi:hypothetical protein